MAYKAVMGLNYSSAPALPSGEPFEFLLVVKVPITDGELRESLEDIYLYNGFIYTPSYFGFKFLGLRGTAI